MPPTQLCCFICHHRGNWELGSCIDTYIVNQQIDNDKSTYLFYQRERACVRVFFFTRECPRCTFVINSFQLNYPVHRSVSSPLCVWNLEHGMLSNSTVSHEVHLMTHLTTYNFPSFTHTTGMTHFLDIKASLSLIRSFVSIKWKLYSCNACIYFNIQYLIPVSCFC